MDVTKGLVFDVKHYAVHDGPGIRVTVFLKGCPLTCSWCHSPESQSMSPELLLHVEKCIGCGRCVEVCPLGAIKSPGEIDRDECSVCRDCAEACFAEAIEIVGEEITVERVLEVVERDRQLLAVSGGGVTISGGEPMTQPEYTVELLRRLKEAGYQTALDTCGYTPWVSLEKALRYVDLMLYDLKHMDPDKHRQHTGAGNELILENLAKSRGLGKRIWIRVPLIPGVNDDVDHLKTLAKHIRALDVERTYILPYHRAGVPKYGALGKEYGLTVEPHDSAQLKEVKELFSDILDNVVVMGIE